jgi:hypothetical protein
MHIAGEGDNDYSDSSSSTTMNGDTLSIVEAWYGDPNNAARGVDVTAILNSMIVNGELHLDTTSRYQYYNYIFGDPAPGTIKVLRIQYRFGSDSDMTVTNDVSADEYVPLHITRTESTLETEDVEPVYVEELKILRAWYGDPNDGSRGVDVTDDVNSLVENNELHLAADSRWFYYNSFFGDPCPGTVKSLQVRYVYGQGLVVSVSVSEDEPLHIIRNNELVIESGWYGDPNNSERGVDVTDILNSMIAGNELHLDTSSRFQYYNAIFSDPCPGTAKTLNIQYHYGNGLTLAVSTGAVVNEYISVDITEGNDFN